MPYTGDKKREYNRIWRAKRREEFFKDKVCSNCGSILKLELHHLNPDEKESNSIWSWSEEHRNGEIEKCIILCKECHKIETHKQIAFPLVHGTLLGYKKKCRCDKCRLANAISKREYRLSKYEQINS